MNNHEILTGVVMLETMWAIRGHDMIDLITPFLEYSIATITTPGDTIDINRVHRSMSEAFGYSDMPKSIIIKALNRKPSLFPRRNGNYVFANPIDSDIQAFEKRREECESKIVLIGGQLAEYIMTHAKNIKHFTSEDAITHLLLFFSHYGLYVGTNRLEEQEMSPKDHEIDYYIAQYIFEKRDASSPEYYYILDLVKGYYLQSAIYLQAENGSLLSSNYSNVTFYYDTPLLIRLLGWKTKDEQATTYELHTALRSRGGKFAFFPQTESEINSILIAYQHSIGHSSTITLEGLDDQGYSVSDVERLRETWETNLHGQYCVDLVSLPAYQQNEAGYVDNEYIIDEIGLRNYILEHMPRYKQDALEADIASALAIHRLRNGLKSEELEKCKSIFVTTNGTLSNCFNRFYRENIERNTFPLLISDTDLSALTWIKTGGKSNLPEKQLLRNAYMAMQPTPEMLERFGNVLAKMEREGRVTPEILTILKTSRYVKKEIIFSSFDGGDGITESIVDLAMAKITEDLRNDMRQDMEKQIDDEKHNRIARADEKARNEALDLRNKVLKVARSVVSVVTFIIIVFAIRMTVISWNSMVLSISFICFALISVFSIIDTGKGREKFVDKYLVKCANRLQTKVFEKKKKEYREIVEYDEHTSD